MEGEAFDPSPQSAMEQEGKKAEDVTTSEEGSSTVEPSGETAQTWRNMVQAKGQALMEHPYVTQSAETVRQTLGQGTAAAQSRLQPIVNHPYMQKSSEILSKGAEQVSASAAQMKPVVDRTTGAVSSKLQPVMRKGAETVQLGKETARKIYNKEEGYEPAKVAPYLVISIGVLLLCILLAGWSGSDGRSKYKVDVTSIVAEKVKLPNGRHIAYVEQGASQEEAKHNVLFVHDLLSSRLLGLSGVDGNLLKKYSVRLVAYDRPGIGQSDPHLHRNLNTSAEDMADIADALGMGNKFWVFAHSGGAVYAWAALHYIPTRLAGVAMFGPLMTPYAKNTTKEERKAMWAGLGPLKSTFQYVRHLPSFVPGKLKKNIQKVNKYMKNTKKRVNSKDRALMETHAFGEAWERAIRESVRSGDPKSHAQDVILQGQDWGFKLSDIRPKPAKRSIFRRIFFFFGGSELPGFSGPIHIFHGTEDTIAPVVMSRYAKRLLPQVELHELEGEGHYSWFFHCNQCHRELFKTLFGEVAGLEELDNPVVPDDSASKEPQKAEEPMKPEKVKEPVKSEKVEEPMKSEHEEAPVMDQKEIDAQRGFSQEASRPQDEL